MQNKAITRQEAPPYVQLAFGRCRHLTTGRTTIPKTCIYTYECWKCAFDQWLDELDSYQESPTVAV